MRRMACILLVINTCLSLFYFFLLAFSNVTGIFLHLNFSLQSTIVSMGCLAFTTIATICHVVAGESGSNRRIWILYLIFIPGFATLYYLYHYVWKAPATAPAAS